MKKFFQLYRKELSGSRNLFLTLLGLIIGIDLFLVTRVRSWGYWTALHVTLIPLIFLLIWAMFRAFMLTREEWKEGTAPFLRSLPISGWGIVGAKLLAAFTEWLFLSLATVLFSGLFYATAPLWGVEWPTLPDLFFSERTVQFIVLSGLNFALGIIMTGLIFQLAYLLGRTVNRFNGLVSFACTVLLFYLTAKGNDLLSRLFANLPGISPEMISLSPNANADLTYLKLNMVVMLIEFALLFVVTGWVMEKKAES